MACEQALVLVLLPAQPVGGVDVLRALRLGLEPRLDRLAQLGVAAQAQREADVGEAESNRSSSSRRVRRRCSSAGP